MGDASILLFNAKLILVYRYIFTWYIREILVLFRAHLFDAHRSHK